MTRFPPGVLFPLPLIFLIVKFRYCKLVKWRREGFMFELVFVRGRPLFAVARFSGSFLSEHDFS